MDIRRKLGVCVLLGIVSLTTHAQLNGFEEAYKAFRQQAIQDYETFRDKVNKEYADFMRQAWERLAGSEYNNVIRDCLELRIRHWLCDWAYLLMLQELSDAFFGRTFSNSQKQLETFVGSGSFLY